MAALVLLLVEPILGAAPPMVDPPRAFLPLPATAQARLGAGRWRHPDGASCVAFSPDGKLLATGGRDRTLCVWDASTGTQVRVFREHQSPCPSIAFFPDGKRLL